MTGQHTTGAIRQLQHLLREGTVAGLSDRQLLERFAARRDEAAFAALVGRHGPMVLGVCRRIVRDASEAEDAFQAAFLVLARKAGSIHVDDTLGRWLYTVTRRIALRADAAAARRARHEPADDSLPAPEAGGRPASRDLLAALDEEMDRLPGAYRSVLALCYLEGLTHDEAARRLRWPLGTVKGRLARARSLLRDRLVRRGLGLSAGAMAASLRPVSVSAALIERAVSAAVGFAAGRAAVAGAFPAAVALAKEALGMMHMAKIKFAAAGLMAFGVVGIGIGRLPGPPPAFAQATPATAERPATPVGGAGGSAAVPNPEELVRKADRLRNRLAEASEALRQKEAEIDATRNELSEIESLRVDIERKRLQSATIQGRSADAPPAATFTDEPRAKARRPGAARPPATEGMKRSFTDYIVEPPDIISIEVQDALPGRPIKGERLVRPDGRISLGFYGDVEVAGLTISQIKEKVVVHLRKYLTDDGLGLIKKEGDRVIAVEPKDAPGVGVDVVAYNSKVYYVQGEVGSPGRFPVTGNETVLDAINHASGLLPNAVLKTIRLIRPVAPGAPEQILPVDLDAIVKRGDTSTNYQIFPGDRLVVYREPAAPDAPQEKADRHRQMEDRIDAMIRELEAFRRELKQGP